MGLGFYQDAYRHLYTPYSGIGIGLKGGPLQDAVAPALGCLIATLDTYSKLKMGFLRRHVLRDELKTAEEF